MVLCTDVYLIKLSDLLGGTSDLFLLIVEKKQIDRRCKNVLSYYLSFVRITIQGIFVSHMYLYGVSTYNIVSCFLPWRIWITSCRLLTKGRYVARVNWRRNWLTDTHLLADIWRMLRSLQLTLAMLY